MFQALALRRSIYVKCSKNTTLEQLLNPIYTILHLHGVFHSLTFWILAYYATTSSEHQRYCLFVCQTYWVDPISLGVLFTSLQFIYVLGFQVHYQKPLLGFGRSECDKQNNTNKQTNKHLNYIKELCQSGDPFPAKQQSFPSQGIGYHSVSEISLSVMGIT